MKLLTTLETTYTSLGCPPVLPAAILRNTSISKERYSHGVDEFQWRRRLIVRNLAAQVVECHVVTDPRTRESRGFGFVTMDSMEDANRCVKYLNRSVLEGRLITVEKVNVLAEY